MSPDELREAHVAMRDRLVAAGLFVPSGVDGLYGRSAAFERVIAGLKAAVGRLGAVDGAVAPASRVQLLANAPNPFNALTELRFSLPRAGRYEIAIHDVSGRRVRTFTGVGEAGRNAIAWNGRDEGGAEVASGVYWYRVTTADGEASASMVLVK